VLSQTPNPRRPDVNSKSTSNSWMDRFRKASAFRNSQVSLWTLTICAFLLPISLVVPSQADSESLNVESTTQDNATSEVQPTFAELVARAKELHSSQSTIQQTTKKTSQNDSQVKSQSSTPDASPEIPNGTPATEEKISSKVETSPEVQTLSAPKPQSTIRFTANVGSNVRTADIAVKPKMTVGHALAAMGISLAVLDRVMPDASALARDGMRVSVTRVTNNIQKRRVAIPAEVRYQPTTKLKPGAKQTVQFPQAGHYEISERVWTRDGKVTQRQFVSKRIAQAPKHRIIALGVASHLMPNAIAPHRRYASALGYRGGSPRDRMAKGGFKAPQLTPANPNTFKVVKSVSVMATGYSAGPAGGAIGNWTATGVRCTYGAVAVDPKVIPLGSKLYIEGYGYGFACDTGGAIKGRRVDLAFNSPRAAFRHGRKQMTVHILAS
jgi:3D (Asp-Asp-Asp) domain-containing protein